MSNLIYNSEVIGTRLSWEEVESLYENKAIVYSDVIYSESNPGSLDDASVIIHGVFNIDDDGSFDLLEELNSKNSVEHTHGKFGLGYTGESIGGVMTCIVLN